jgi:hypothetical protein
MKLISRIAERLGLLRLIGVALAGSLLCACSSNGGQDTIPDTGSDHSKPIDSSPSDSHDTVHSGDTAKHSDSVDSVDSVDSQDSEDSPDSVETGPTGWEDTVTETVPDAPDPSDYIYSIDMVHEVDITLSAESVAALGSDPFAYVTGDIDFDGTSFTNVGIHLKGRLGSYRALSGKAGFKVDLNHYVDGLEFYGETKFTFNNLVQDSSFVHQPAAYYVYRAMGLAAPRIGYAWITVNGSDYGIYEVSETFDDTFLARNFTDPDGNMYNGDYFLYPDWSSYILVDFEDATQDLFELTEGTDILLADVYAVTAAMDTYARTDDFFDEVGLLVNWDWHAHYLAVENWVGQYDGYSYNSNNYYVYFDPEDGKAKLFPWDHDWAFYSSTPLHRPTGRLSAACVHDDECEAVFLDAVEDVCSTFDAGTAEDDALIDEIRTRIDLIDPYIEADPRKETSVASIHSSQATLLDWLENRSPSLRSVWGI